MRINSTLFNRTIPSVFQDQARNHPDRVAIITRQGRVTYAQLDRFSDVVANTLIEMGHRHGETVGVFLEQGSDQIAAILGVLKAGGIYVPLDSSLPRQRLRDILGDSATRFILSDRVNQSGARLLGGAGQHVIEADSLPLARLNGNSQVRASSSHDLAYIYYTSGSSGTPKGVVDNHRNVLHNVARYTSALRVSSADRLTLVQSCGFSGAVSNIFTALLNGATLLPFDVKGEGVAALADWLAEQRPTIFHSVPSLFRQLMSFGVALPSLRIVRLEGDLARPIDVDTFNRHFDARCTLVNGLGATETGISAQHFISHGTVLTDTAVPVGRPTMDIRIEVVDPHGRKLPPGETGEILVSSRFLACGYWRRPDLTDAVFSIGADGVRSYRTRDLGRVHADGLLELCGRADLMAKVNGEWTDLGALERALARCPGVRDAIAAVHANRAGNSSLTAWVVQDGVLKVPSEHLRASLIARGVAPSMVPAKIVPIDRWPLDPNGKIDRSALLALTETTSRAKPPGTPSERMVAAVFQKLLGVQVVSVTDNFFELGGDSLAAMAARNELRRLTGSEIVSDAFHHASNVSAIARLLDGTVEPGCLVPLQPDGVASPLFCVHAHSGHVFNLRNLAQQFAPERPFYGIQARALNGPAEPPSSIEAMADDYVEALLEMQPKGPYFIAGYCFGSWVAVEIARRLRGRGAEVAALFLIDASLPIDAHAPRHRSGRPWKLARSFAVGPRRQAWLAARSRFRSILDRGNNSTAGRRRGRARDLVRRVASARSGSAAYLWLGARLCIDRARMLVVKLAAGRLDRDSWLSRYLLKRPGDTLTVMAVDYRPEFYEGPAVVLIPRDKALTPPERQAWERFIRGGIEFEQLAGSTHDLLRQPCVRDLAARLLGRLPSERATEGH
jgi:amino acid adenylation domain-containing protein